MTIRDRISNLPLSPTLRANQQAAARRAAGMNVLHMGFGQAPFPVHEKLQAALAASSRFNNYENVSGNAVLRERASEYLANKLGLESGAYDCLVAPGSKLILYALQMAIEGDVIIPMPSWVSYEPQARMLGDRILWLAADLGDEGYRVQPENLAAFIGEARARGANPAKLILNSPNNPTGLSIPLEDYAGIAQVCRDNDVFIISDEIYALVSFDGVRPSIAGACGTNAAVTTGLSKHLSLGGWRVGFGLVPTAQKSLFDALNAIASETWSGVATPVQHAALVAVSGDDDIEAYIGRCTEIHAAVAKRAARIIRSSGLHCPMPQGGFYLWADFNSHAEALENRGITDSIQLADVLLADADVLALPGTGFGAAAEHLVLRLSVCDYDGAEALRIAGNSDNLGEQVDGLAPRVIEAAEAIAEFVAALH
jgi:aspartate/methionine/tyrosine aminotransferase